MFIHPAHLDDLAQLVNIARIVVRDMHRQSIQQWTDLYPGYKDFFHDLSQGGLYVCCDATRIIGSISCLMENERFYHEISWLGTHALVVHRIMVHPDYRHLGIGKKMFLHAIQTAIAMNCDTLKVDTHPDNHRMIQLIQSLGFRKRGYIPSMHRIGFEIPLQKESTP